SFGCENNTAHESPIHSWNLIGPSVVCASKSGAVSPICKAMSLLPYLGVLGWSTFVLRLSARGAVQIPELCSCCTQRRPSGVEDCQVELAEALSVGDHLDLDDPAGADREAEHNTRPPAGRPYQSHGSVY